MFREDAQGVIGVSDPERPSGPPTPAQQLVRAAISPFSAAAIALHGTNLLGILTVTWNVRSHYCTSTRKRSRLH